MNIGVANRHWGTAGGGEAYTLALVRALRRHGHAITLLGPPDTAWDDLGRRFGFDDVAGDEVSFDDEAAFARTGASFDLLVNAGHATQLASPARAGVLIVHFPRDHGSGLGRWGRSLLRAFVRHGRARNRNVTWGPGFYASGEVGRLLRWTDGEGSLVVHGLRPGHAIALSVTFGTDRPTPADVTVTPAGGEAFTTAVVPHEARRVSLRAAADDDGVARLTISSTTFVPADVWHGVRDRRPHGVPIVDVTVGHDLLRRLLDRSDAWRRTELLGFATTYDALLCHSHYTSRWVRRWWGLTPRVVEPPVRLREPGDKASIILAVGRFFAPDRGHSKRQLELVEAFRRLVASGLDGWELHLAGGCDPEDATYLDAVRAAAEGLPVTFHVDAPTEVLDDLYARATLFWHATGLGIDPDENPEAHEHFGIAVVEAMSAGAVPLVHGTGGPAEIVRDGVDGCHFRTLGELVGQTRALIDDATRLSALSRSARERSLRYGTDRFDDALIQVIDDALEGR